MGKSKWKDLPDNEPEPCGCRHQVRKSLHARPLKPGQLAYRIKKCATHAPKVDTEPVSWTYEEFWDLW